MDGPEDKQGGGVSHPWFTPGHFLMPSHVPHNDGCFLCSQRDLLLLKPKEGDGRARLRQTGFRRRF